MVYLLFRSILFWLFFYIFLFLEVLVVCFFYYNCNYVLSFFLSTSSERSVIEFERSRDNIKQKQDNIAKKKERKARTKIKERRRINWVKELESNLKL